MNPRVKHSTNRTTTFLYQVCTLNSVISASYCMACVSVREGTGRQSYEHACICEIPDVLAHRIRISEILPWDRKSYLTQAILPRLSREGYTHWLHWNSRTWSSSEDIVMLKLRHYVKLHLYVFKDFWITSFQCQNLQWSITQKKKNYFLLIFNQVIYSSSVN